MDVKTMTSEEVNAKIIEILNADLKSREILEVSMNVAKRNNLTKDETEKVRELVLLVSIQGNKEAMDLLAEHIYYTLRGEK